MGGRGVAAGGDAPDGRLDGGRHDGLASALTVVLPLRWGGRTALVAWLWILRRRTLRRRAVGTLDGLRFVSAIRWSLLPPFRPPGPWPWRRPHDERWQLLFESNFDGDWDDYLEVFGAVQGWPLRSITAWGAGWPGLDDVALFKAYAKSFDHEPEHYASAYPSLTSGDVFQELMARDPGGARRRVRQRGYGRTHPAWTTLLLPLAEDRAAAAVRAARALEHPPDGGEPLVVRTGLVHFGRVVVLDRPSGSWLLVTLTHDGTAEEVVAALVAADAATDPDGATTPLRRLVECTVGAPDPSRGWWDDAATCAHLLRSRPRAARHQTAYCGYPGTTVAEVRDLADRPRRHETWPVREPQR